MQLNLLFSKLKLLTAKSLLESRLMHSISIFDQKILE